MTLITKIKSVCLFLFLISSFLSFPKQVEAASDFKTNYIIKYSVNDDASVDVEQKTSLINQLSEVYATQYMVTVSSTQIKNIKASDGTGFLEPEITKISNATKIKIVFKEKVVGIDKQLNFTLWYTTADFSNLSGQVLEVTIPKLSQTEGVNDYQVELSVPLKFQEPAFIQPKPDRTFSAEASNIYYFSQKKVLDQGITATFGQYQIFNFQLNYHLNNPNKTKAEMEISLPPDSSYQQILLQTLKPAPVNVRIDEDGNWLALYLLEKQTNFNITATGSAIIYLKPVKDFNFKIDNIDKFLKEDEYWPIADKEITDLALELKTPENIYNYVVKNLIYDYGRVNQDIKRLGAKEALRNKESSLCMEFTDVFVALSRAAGIPGREVNGYAYTRNPQVRPISLEKDILHSWPEYYDPILKIWVPVDPTWGNTTGGVDFFHQLDLNHFAFVFHGLDSQLPLPAGAYKNSEFQEKTVNVTFGKRVNPKLQSELIINLPKKITAGLGIKGQVIVKNSGNMSISNQSFSFWSDDLKVGKKQIPIPTLAPFGHFVYDFNLGRSSYLFSGNKSLTVHFSDKESKYFIKVAPFFLVKSLAIAMLTLSCVILILIVLIKLKKLKK